MRTTGQPGGDGLTGNKLVLQVITGVSEAWLCSGN